MDVLYIIPQIPIAWTMRETLLINSLSKYYITQCYSTPNRNSTHSRWTTAPTHNIYTKQKANTLTNYSTYVTNYTLLSFKTRYFLHFLRLNPRTMYTYHFWAIILNNESNLIRLKYPCTMGSINSRATANTKDLPSIAGFLSCLFSSSSDKTQVRQAQNLKRCHLCV